MSDNEGLEEYEEVQTELRKKEEEEVCVCGMVFVGRGNPWSLLTGYPH